MKTLIIIFLAIMSINSMAGIVCHTPRLNKVFEINDNKITFIHEIDQHKNRELASVNSRNKTDLSGLNKIVNFENEKHTIHIENTKNFSDVDDYIVIRNQIGHEITYPLSCSNK